ncbi:hypothetical protein C8F01DRAFT_1117621 [Mycena amicta]|nr:hypothetical protein C8F01DRAFT_1117621 [Mycena amicta]
MALFTENPLRSAATVVAALFAAHVAAKFLSFFHIFHFSQAVVAALIAIGLMYLITRQEGHSLTQKQAEALLIGCLAVVWMSVLVGWQAALRDGGIEHIDERPSTGAGMRELRPYPCTMESEYCVVEDYYW